MRLPGVLTAIVTSTLGMTLAPYAISQDYAPANLEAVTNYCFYGGTLYSVGARLCVPGVNEGSFTLVCKSKDEDNDASKTVMLFGVLISDHRRPIAEGAHPNFLSAPVFIAYRVAAHCARRLASFLFQIVPIMMGHDFVIQSQFQRG